VVFFYSLSLLLLVSFSKPSASSSASSRTSSGIPIITNAFKHVMRLPVSHVPISWPTCFAALAADPFDLGTASSLSVLSSSYSSSEFNSHSLTAPSLLPVMMIRLLDGDDSVEKGTKISKSLIRPAIPAALPPSCERRVQAGISTLFVVSVEFVADVVTI